MKDESAVQRWLCRTCDCRFSDPNHKKNCNSKLLEVGFEFVTDMDRVAIFRKRK